MRIDAIERKIEYKISFQIWSNFLFQTMDYIVHSGCMYTNFGGCSLSSFGDIVTIKFGQTSLLNHGL